MAITPICRHLFSPWSDPVFLRAGVSLERVSRHVVVTTDTSESDWGDVCHGHAALGPWTGTGKPLLVWTDNTATVAYLNCQGGIRSHCMSQLTRHNLLWSQQRLKSVRATHILGVLNHTADTLLIWLIWSRFGEVQVDLFVFQESSHCPL